MPIVAADIVYRYSVTTGPGDSTGQGSPSLSLGEFISTTVCGEALNDLFDDVSGAENAASDVEYRCIFVLNNHGSLTLQGAKVWLSNEVAGGANVAIAVDTTGITNKTSASAQAIEIADESDSGNALSGQTFSSPTTEGTALAIGNIGPGQCQAIWWRRTAANTAAIAGDGATIRVKGDTAA